MDKEQIKKEIKEIVYSCAYKGGMCEDFIDGQIIGLRTGDGLELDMVAIVIAGWYCDKVIAEMISLKEKLQ